MTKLTNGNVYVQEVVTPDVVVDNNYTGIITVTTAGTPVSGGDVVSSDGFVVKPHPDNTDTVWVFPDGRTKSNGFPLNVGEQVILRVSNLNLLDFDADVNGEKLCWIKI